MAKFRKKKSGGQQAINTASLPDIVFMLLFFFMVSTTMKEVDMKVQIKPAQATELATLEKKELVTFIYVGVPAKKFQALYGSEPRIQLNDQFATVPDIQSYIAQSRDAMRESDQPKMTVSIKADRECPMGVITDIKQALRKAAALKINYSAAEMVKNR
ncbi:biopolymer transporter ExbD [Carboxylicivirga mesophila]|uniref:Biopolymer transporter ExbD n=2 Tax=Carboxylicivirga TaxID=1628153 RepID=A0A941IVW4_9BACT|nr:MULTISPECIES: biopolymer transporter ExbD [Carboxylicivirga]MBR8534283.1 biopolymer transporter ExbD [Carboxylicivirga sediminis]MBS2210441.1 biopolymer transporter ExbD [Carboxylicivirga mesophila]